jgi:uncharacterized membrane protein
MALPGLLRRRPATTVSLLIGLAAGTLAAAGGLAWPRVVQLGWCANTLAYMVLLLRHMLGRNPAQMRAAAQQLQEGRRTLFGLSVVAGFVALGAVVWDLGLASGNWSALAITTVVLSWAYMHALFAQDYAHEYWLRGEGFDFPGTEEPPFTDFLYVAFTIGMTAQLSDTPTTTPAMRRSVLLHGLIAFTFNAVILAATVNIVAGLGK